MVAELVDIARDMSTNDKVTCPGVSENTGVSEDSVVCSDVKEKKCNRKVSFPLDDEIVTQYFEPSNPWQDVPSTTRAQLAAEYLEACRCHNTPAIESVLQQIRELPENTIGGSMRAPRLALSDCSLLGTAPVDALEALLRKVQFRRLELDHAEMDDEGAEALFDMVEYYESTTVLCLIGPRQFGIRGWQAASRMIKKSAELSEIEISESPLEANHAPVLARSLRPASCRLRSVCLQRAELAGDPLLCLVIALKTNNSVRELRLGDNRLSAADASQIANLLRYNTHLQLLDLSNNQLQDAGVGVIAEALVAQAAHSPPSPHQCPLGSYESKGLAFLVLWNNQLTRNCAGHLAKVLRSSQSLCVLNVGRNALGSDAVRALQTDRIGGGPLVSLGLQAARLGPDAARAIADLIRNDTKLQRLDLRDNKLGAAGLQAILNAMKENTTLTQIDLDDPAETTTSVGVQSCTESATVARLLRDIRALCRRNEPAAPAPPDRLLRKISLTCHTAPAPKQQSLPTEEERKVRLRSPAPSPAPSPAGSPVPAGQGHSRFSVIPVTSDRASVSTDSTSSQAPRTAYSPTASRFKVVQVADPPQIQVQHTPRKTRFSVTRNYDTTYNPTLPPTTPSPSPSPSPSSSPAPEINLDYNPDNVNADKSSNVHENKPIFDYTTDTNNACKVKTDNSSKISQNEPIFDYTTDNNKNKAKQEEEISIDLNSMFITDAKSIIKTEQSKDDIKQGDLNKNNTQQMKNDIKNVTVSMRDSKSCEQIIKTEIKNDNIVIKLDNTAKSKDSNIMQLDSNTETKDSGDIKLGTVTKAKFIQDDRAIKQETTKNPKVTHDVITDAVVKPKFIEETEPQYVVSKTVLLPKIENRTVLTQTEEIMNIPEFISNIQQEVKSKNDSKTTKVEKVCEMNKNGGDWDRGVDKNIETIVIREDLKNNPESIDKDLKESSKSVNMPESVINEPKFDPELISNLGPEITHVTEFYEKPEKLATIFDSISKESESKDVINVDVRVSDSNAKTITVSSLNNEKLKATNVIGDCSDNIELINISDTNKYSESGEIERFGDKIEQMSHNETVDYVGDDKIVKTETKLVKSSIEASETDRVETEVSVIVRSENNLKTKVHRDQNVNKLVKEEKREVAIKQIEAITEDLGNIIQEMQDLSTKTIKKTATEDINVDIGDNVPAVRDSVVLKKNRSESSLDSPDLEVSRLMRKPISAFCDSSSSLEISGSSVESLNIERVKPIIIHEETRMSKESSVESTSEVTPVNLNVSISSNESVSPIIFGITKKIHGSLSSLEASMSSVDSARHEKVMVTSADSGIEYSLQNPSEIREDSSSNEGTLTCSSSLKESVKKESTETTSPKRTSSLLDVPALKSKGLDRMRKISWVAPSASFHLPRPEEKVEYKLPTNLEKLLSLFQHPSSLFSRNNSDDEKKSASSTPPRKDSSLTSSFWSWGSLTEKADKDDADSLSEATDSTLSERVQVSFVDESFSKKLDSKTPSTDTDNTLSEFQTFPNSGESLPNSGVSNHNSGELIHNRGENLTNSRENAEVTELTTDDNLVQKSLALRDNDACPDEPGACDIIDLNTPNDLNRNITQTSEKLDSGDRADTAACSETILKLEDEKVDVRPRTFASVLTGSTENSLEKQTSPEAGHPVDKLPSKVIRGIKENISPENTLTSSITTKALAIELGERQTKNKTIVNAVWEVSMPCVEKSEPKAEEVKTQSDLAPIATIDETSDVAADDLIQLAYIDDPKVEERVVDIDKDVKTIEKLAADKVDLGKDALSYLMDEITNDFEAETAHSVTEVKSPQGSLAQELRDAEIKEMLDLSPELVIDDAVEIPEIFTVEIKGRKSSPVIPERAKLKKSNSLEDLTKRPVEDKESPKLKTIAFKVPESTTPRDIPERRSKLRSRSGSSPKSLPESLNKPCPLTKMDSVISKKKKKASSLGKTARDSLLMLNMSEEEIAEFRRPYKLTSVESLRSLESVSEDANSQSGTSVDSRCRACLRTSQESLMSLDSITEDCRCMEECEKRHSNR